MEADLLRSLARLLLVPVAVSLVLTGASGASGNAGTPSRSLSAARSLAPVRAGEVATGDVLVRFRRGREPKSAGAVGARALTDIGGAGWKKVSLLPGETVDDALARLASDPNVVAVSADHVYHALSVPDDTFYPLQWGLPIISAPTAWDTSTGGSVTVAVVDSGVAVDHPDLAPNIDLADAHSWVNTSSGGHPTYYDQLGHGTHVSGIIGAVANDGYGVAGVAPNVKIMPLRALNASGSGYTSNILQAFHWAATHGARVVNASLGGTGYDQAFADEIAADSNTLFVVAAGNGGGDNIGAGWNDDSSGQAIYPCAYTAPNLICVAASDQNDAMASFSNYGPVSVDLAAPGFSIASTVIPTAAGYGGSGYALADSPNGGYGNNADSWAELTQPVDLSGRTGCSLNYEISGSLNDAGDAVRAETSSDETSWTTIATFQGSSGYGARSVSLPDGQTTHVRFHLVSDGSGSDDGVYIDNVSVTCSDGLADPFAVDDFAGGSTTGWTFGGTTTWGTTSIVGKWQSWSGTSMATPFVSGAAALLFSASPSASVLHVKDVLLGSVDPEPAFATTTVSGGRLNVARALQVLSDVTPPTNVALTGTGISHTFQMARSFTLGWRATDLGSGVRSYDVRYQAARFNGTLGRWIAFRTNDAATSATFASSPGYSYCFQVRARDRALNTSSWSASHCTAFPLNDTNLTASSGWLRRLSSLRYLGTYSYSSTRSSSLSVTGVRYKHLYLIVTATSGSGEVQVYRGSTRIGTFSLASSTTWYKHQIVLSRLSSLSAGATITIRVYTSGRAIEIEGLGVAAF